MVRYPNGVEGDFFHQKRVPSHPEYVGEQYVDLQPQTDDGPFLHDGSQIALQDTRTPLLVAVVGAVVVWVIAAQTGAL